MSGESFTSFRSPRSSVPAIPHERGIGWKSCSKCGSEKEATEFYRDRSKRDGLDSQCKECQAAYSAKRYERNSEKMKAAAARWYRENSGRVAAYQKNRYQSEESYRLIKLMRARLLTALRKNQKEGVAVRNLGCSIERFREHIAAQFAPGMTWDNHGEWHLDHVRPLASFDLTDDDQVRVACHYSNIQPLWAEDNHAKSRKFRKEEEA